MGNEISSPAELQRASQKYSTKGNSTFSRFTVTHTWRIEEFEFAMNRSEEMLYSDAFEIPVVALEDYNVTSTFKFRLALNAKDEAVYITYHSGPFSPPTKNGEGEGDEGGGSSSDPDEMENWNFVSINPEECLVVVPKGVRLVNPLSLIFGKRKTRKTPFQEQLAGQDSAGGADWGSGSVKSKIPGKALMDQVVDHEDRSFLLADGETRGRVIGRNTVWFDGAGAEPTARFLRCVEDTRFRECMDGGAVTLRVRFNVMTKKWAVAPPGSLERREPRDPALELARECRWMLETQTLCDAVLKCGGWELPCHRFVLAARSRVLRAWLRENPPDPAAAAAGEPESLMVADLTPEVLRYMVEFMYTDRTGGLPGRALELLVAAAKYDVPALRQAAADAVLAALAAGGGDAGGPSPASLAAGSVGAADLVRYADRYENRRGRLWDAALLHLRRHRGAVEREPGWQALRRERPELALQAMEESGA